MARCAEPYVRRQFESWWVRWSQGCLPSCWSLVVHCFGGKLTGCGQREERIRWGRRELGGTLTNCSTNFFLLLSATRVCRLVAVSASAGRHLAVLPTHLLSDWDDFIIGRYAAHTRVCNSAFTIQFEEMILVKYQCIAALDIQKWWSSSFVYTILWCW